MNIEKMIDAAVDQFRRELKKEFLEPEPKLTGTQFECIDTNGELFVAKADELEVGTLILVGDWEVFRIVETPEQKPWITYIGDAYTHLKFAEAMRDEFVKPKIVHNGL